MRHEKTYREECRDLNLAQVCFLCEHSPINVACFISVMRLSTLACAFKLLNSSILHNDVWKANIWHKFGWYVAEHFCQTHFFLKKVHCIAVQRTGCEFSFKVGAQLFTY